MSVRSSVEKEAEAEELGTGADGSEGSGPFRGVLLPILIGLVIVGVGGYVYVDEGAALDSGVEVDATVVGSDVEQRIRYDADGDRRTVYYPRVTYEYSVDGETYRSSNLRAGLGRESMLESNARRTVERYPVGAQVTAYYDPENPSRAFLVAGRSSVPLIAGGLGAFFVLIGVASEVKRALGRLV